MNPVWEKYKFRIVGAAIGLVLNAGLLGISMLTAEGGGALIYIYANFPIFILAEWLSGTWEHFFSECIFAGLLIYATLGWVLMAWFEKNYVRKI
ncbi:hypothetical protein [Candidatus Nitrospira salsa]